MIKVFLVDDHEIFRNGLKQLISSEADMEVVGEAVSGEDALQKLAMLHPDVVIMDIRMPGLNGVETSKILLKQQPDLSILFFSLFNDPNYVASALELGASGYILKDTSNKIFLNAIRAVHNGQYYFIGEVSDVLVRTYHAAKKQITLPASTTDVSLSKREKEIVQLVSDGMANKEIALKLELSIRTIEAHRFNIMRKYKVNTMDDVINKLEH